MNAMLCRPGFLLAVVVGLLLAALAAPAEEPEFQIVGTLERQTLSLSILPRTGYRLGASAPVQVRLDGVGVELPRRLLGRDDAVDPRAEAPRFAVRFNAAKPGAHIDAELTFYVCKAARCRPVVTRYTTNL